MIEQEAIQAVLNNNYCEEVSLDYLTIIADGRFTKSRYFKGDFTPVFPISNDFLNEIILRLKINIQPTDMLWNHMSGNWVASIEPHKDVYVICNNRAEAIKRVIIKKHYGEFK